MPQLYQNNNLYRESKNQKLKEKQGLLLKFTANKEKRPLIANIVLYAIQILVVIVLIVLLPRVLWSLSLLDDPDWSFSDIYGKGFLPVWLLAFCIGYGNYKVIRWKKDGLFFMMYSSLILFLPLMWNEFQEFVVFILCAYLGIFFYWLILRVKKNGISTWSMCEGNSRRNPYIAIAILVVMTCLLPPVVGYTSGFVKKIYNHGVSCVNAHLNSSYYYKCCFAQEIAFDTNRRGGDKQRTAEKWFIAALDAAKVEPDIFWRNYAICDVYASYICFLLKNEDIVNAKMRYDEAQKFIPIQDVRNVIIEDPLLCSYISEFDKLIAY